MQSRAGARTIAKVLIGAVVMMLAMLSAAPAFAVPGPVGSPPMTRDNTDLVMTGTGAGQGVSGGIAPIGSSFDPLGGYPSDIPAGFEPLNEGFAGIITAKSQTTGDTLLMYCIDIRTSTYPGIGYENGTWDGSNVPNVGYVARVLNDYYPTTNLPAAANDNLRAAAVQSAIWFFTDKYVLTTTEPARPLVEAIVADVISKGPLVQPPPPSLTITPATDRGPADSPLGPFTINADAGTTVTVSATGADMFSDASGTTPIANNTAVPPGQQIWLSPTDPGASDATLFARGTATVPTGNVYLYDHNTPGVNDAQRLILAQTGQVATTTQATAEFYDTGSLIVSKTIAGSAAGQQGPVTISVTCNGTALDDFVIPAGTAGDQSRTYDDIETPATCEITETADGGTSAVTVVTVNGSQTVTLPGNDTANDPVDADPITNTYEPAPGQLVITKAIAGSAVGQQGPIVLHVSCTNGFEEDISIPAESTGGTTQTIAGLPAGTVCTVTETSDGATTTVTVTTSSSGNPATVPAGDTVAVNFTNTYEPAPGELVITKTIAGSAAGQQGAIVLHVSCTNGLEEDISIPAETTADTTRTFTDLPAGTVCTVTEPSNGDTSDTTVTTNVLGTVIIPAGGRLAAQVVNTYTEDVSPIVPPVPPAPPVPPTPTPHPVLPATGVPASLPGIAAAGLVLILAGALLQLPGRLRRNS